ncbi:MAG TPA: hypothetical protein VNG33_02410, partial [Polyangiaceae bacterium]|nr:hypothetical protein [Polyangiaceae bacterium]
LVEALRRAENSPEPVFEKRTTIRTPSGVMRLSELPETDVGEAAARAVTGEDVAPIDRRSTVRTPPITVGQPAHVTMPAASGGGGGESRPRSEPPPKHATSLASRLADVAAPAPAPAASAAFSFAPLFPSAEQGVVQVVESALALGDPAAAITAMDQLVARGLAAGAALAGSSHDAPRDPALVALLLGVEPRRYLKFRGLVREARQGTLLSLETALAAYAFVLDLRRALRDAG